MKSNISKSSNLRPFFHNKHQQNSQSWSGVQPTCRPIQCGVLKAPKYGSLLCSDADSYGSTCKFFCDLGYSIEGSKDRECSENGWSGEQPQCIEVRCGQMEYVHHGKTECSNEDKFSSVCTNECDSGFQLVGSRVRSLVFPYKFPMLKYSFL